MAKSGTFEHPKTKRLARLLKAPNYAALGLLEAFWHWVGRYAPTGQIDTDAMEDCADTLRFDEGGEVLAEILTGSGWLDALEDGTYYVHDWHDHATDAVKKDLQRTGRKFANGAPVRKTKTTETQEEPRQDPHKDTKEQTLETTPSDSKEESETMISTVIDKVGTVSRQDRDKIATPQPNPTQPNPTKPRGEKLSTRSGREKPDPVPTVSPPGTDREQAVVPEPSPGNLTSFGSMPDEFDDGNRRRVQEQIEQLRRGAL